MKKHTKKIAYESLFGILWLSLILFMFHSCAQPWDGEYDFKNYIRDQHPYSEIIEINFNDLYSFRVNDTLNNQVWIYSTGAYKHEISSYCFNCE